MVVVQLWVTLEVARIALAEGISLLDNEHVLLTILAVHFNPLGDQIGRYCYLFLLLLTTFIKSFVNNFPIQSLSLQKPSMS